MKKYAGILAAAALAALSPLIADATCIVSGSTERPLPGTVTLSSSALSGALDAVTRTSASCALNGALNSCEPAGGTIIVFR